MSTQQDVPKEITESIRNELGDKGKHIVYKLVKVEPKTEKWEDRLLVLSVCRAYLFTFPTKPPAKLEYDFHFLDIQSFESRKPLQLRIGVGDKSRVYLMTSIGDADDVITHIAVSLKKYFPYTPFEKFVKVITLEPASRHEKIKEHLNKLSSVEQSPCGGFSNMYACMCDLHQMPYREEVAWDIDTIYVSQNNKEMCLNDFDHLESRDMVPVISSLRYNRWFNKISAKGVKLSSEASKQIAKVLMKNPNIQELHLENTNIHRWDFGQELATALQVPSSLHALNLKGNHIDDRGVQHLCGIIPKLSVGLTELNLSNTKISTKGRGASNLGTNLAAGKAKKTLKKLFLSDNSFKGEEFAPLLTFLANPNVVSHLDLSNSETALDSVFPALLQGCLHTLTHLNLSRNILTNRKSKDLFIPQAMKEYFATTTALKYVNLSGNRLPPQFVKDVLLGIASNGAMRDLELDISNNELKAEGSRVLESCIATIHAIGALDISGNGLEGDLASVVDWIGTNIHIKKLSIGNNLHTVRQNKKQLNRFLDTIVKLLQVDDGSLEWFSMADCKLKAHTASVLDAVGSNTVLTYLDISGNGMGDVGTRSLAKALQLNTKLKTVKLDRNDISVNGLQDLADSLERNHTLESMPTPVSDAGNAWRTNPEKTDAAILKIEELLMRNNSSAQYDAEVIDQAYRTQQSFHVSTSQQVVDKLTADVQQAADHLAGCEDETVLADVAEAMKYVQDGHNSKEMLNSMYLAPRESTQKMIDAKIQELKDLLTTCVKEQLQKSVDEMLNCGERLCPSIVKEELKSGIQETAHQKSQISETYVAEWVEQKAGAAIANKASELHLAAATAVCNKITDELVDCLSKYRTRLNVHLSTIAQNKNKNGKIELDAMENIETKDSEVNKVSESSTLRKRKSVRPKSVFIKDLDSSNTSLSSIKEEKPNVRPFKRHQYEEIDLISSPDDKHVFTDENSPYSSSPSLDMNTSEDELEREKGSGDDLTSPPSTPAFTTMSDSDSPPAVPTVSDFDSLPSPTHAPLKTVTVNRPRKPKRVRPTRPVLTTTTEDNKNKTNALPDDDVEETKNQDIDVSQGVNNFFETTTVMDPAILKPATMQQSSHEEVKKTKKDKTKDKRKEKKDKDKEVDAEKEKPPKPDKKPKKVKEETKKSKKGIFSNIKRPTFLSSREKSPSSKKSRNSVAENEKEKAKEKQKSQEDLSIYEEVKPQDQEPGEDTQQEVESATRNAETEVPKVPINRPNTPEHDLQVVGEESEKEEEPAIIVPKKPIGVPMFGGFAMPGMTPGKGGDIFSEMKQKQDQKLSNKQKADENKRESEDFSSKNEPESRIPSEKSKQEAKAVESTSSLTKTQPSNLVEDHPSSAPSTKDATLSDVTTKGDISPKPRPRSSRVERPPSTKVTTDTELTTKGNVSPKPKQRSSRTTEQPPPMVPFTKESTDTDVTVKGNISPKPKPRSLRTLDQPASTVPPKKEITDTEVPVKGNISPKPKPKSRVPEQPPPMVPSMKETSDTDVTVKGNISPKPRQRSSRTTDQPPPVVPSMKETTNIEVPVKGNISPKPKPKSSRVTEQEPPSMKETTDMDVTVKGNISPKPTSRSAKISEQTPTDVTSSTDPDKISSLVDKDSSSIPKDLISSVQVQKSDQDKESHTTHESNIDKQSHVMRPIPTEVSEHQSSDMVPHPPKLPQEQTAAPELKNQPITDPEVTENKPTSTATKVTVKAETDSKAETIPPKPSEPPTIGDDGKPSIVQTKGSEQIQHQQQQQQQQKQHQIMPHTSPRPDTPSPPSSRKSRTKPPPPIKPKPKPASLKKPAITAKKPESPPLSPKSPRLRSSSKRQNEGIDRTTQQRISVKARAKLINIGDYPKAPEEKSSKEGSAAEGTNRSKSFSKMTNDKVDQDNDTPERSKSLGAAKVTARGGYENIVIIEGLKEDKEPNEQTNVRADVGTDKKIVDEEKKDNKGSITGEDSKKDLTKEEETQGKDGKIESKTTEAAKSLESSIMENKSEDEGSSELDLEGEGYVFV
ncbi:uncharacterized protein LOC144438163 isoform X1 [Glandiceps talaboti]